MPRALDARFDFRGGANRTFSPDVMDATEVVTAKNCRLTQYGALSKRGGSQRIHSDDLGSLITGLYQWDNPSRVGELVAIEGSSGDLMYKTLAATTWTVVAASLHATNRVSFAPYKTGGTNRLYFADGTLRKWTATTLTTSISGSPSGAAFLAVYGERMFCVNNTPTVYWSKINDPETWSAPDGGQANVETYDSEPIVALATVGSSLLLFKEDSIARFTGTTAAAIEIRKETEGVSPDVGCIAPGTVVRVDDFVFFLSDRGPYIANESGAQPIGIKIEAEMANWDKANRSKAWAVHNKDRREIWLFVPTVAGGVNSVAWCWNVRTQTWTGPWTFGYNVSVAAAFERTDGTEGVLLGGTDGWVRDGDNSDNGAKDDVAVDDTGGSAIEMQIEYPPLLFGSAGTVKLLHGTQFVHADLGASGSLVATGYGEERGSTASSRTIASGGAGVTPYRFNLAWRGRRPRLLLTESTANAVTINGIEIEAQMGRRVA